MKIIYNLGDKTILYLIFNRINGFVESAKRKSGTASVYTDSQWSKQEARFARATHVWLAVNYNIWRVNSMFEANGTRKWA